jgi:hypothetical protein
MLNEITWSGFLDKLHQGFNLLGKLYMCRHCPSPPLLPISLQG